MKKKNFYETKFYKILEKIGNLIALNFIFVIVCIPIFTIGASITALYSAVHSDMSYKSFFSSYRKNWKQSTIVWLFMIFFIDITMFNWYLVVAGAEKPSVFAIVALVFSIFFAGMFFSWTFELISLFDNKLRDTIWNAVALGLGNLPVTVASVCLHMIFPTVVFFYTDKILQYGWIWLGFGFSVVVFLCDKMLIHAVTKSTGVVFPTDESVREER